MDIINKITEKIFDVIGLGESFIRSYSKYIIIIFVILAVSKVLKLNLKLKT